LSYPLDKMIEEVAFIAYHFHWPQTEIMVLEHDDRVQWVTEIEKINERRNQEDIERIDELRGR